MQKLFLTVMTVFPNAKINFGLKVLRRRSDGYHDLETVFLPVRGLRDEIDIEVVGGDTPSSFIQKGIVVDCSADDNLVMRVVRLMQHRFPKVGEVAIRFTKNIPFGAGLGGGSADAAFTAKALNTLFELCLSDAELEEMVAPLGADCPFFVQNRPRLAKGIGDVFEEVPQVLSDSLNGRWLLLVKPDAAVSTAAAYRGIVPRESDGQRAENGKSYFVWDGTFSSFTNDFEQTVFPLFPQISDVKRRLLNAGALHAAMSGSGATVFGLFERPVERPEDLFSGCFVHQEQLSF